MSHLSAWVSPQLAHTLGWSLLHFVWQGLALAAICSALMAMCRAASARYAIALVTLALMLAAPGATFFFLQHSAANLASAAIPSAVPSTVVPTSPALSPASAAVPVSKPSPSSPAPIHPDVLFLFVEAWFAGVVFFSLRTTGGLIVIARVRRNRTRPVADALLEKCLALQRRIGLSRGIRYCECLALEAPAVIGWFRPVVLLPASALSGLSQDQLAAVISHELAHIRRLDCFVNLFQIAAETLLFYHPAVWWLNKRIRAERENCCDDAALAVCGDAVEYARALALMEEWRQQPVMAMAVNGSPLVARVARLLGVSSPRSGIRSAGVAASVLCLVGALLAANALMAAGHSSPNIFGSLYPAHEAASDTSPRLSASSTERLTNSPVSQLAPSVARTRVARANPSASLESQAQVPQYAAVPVILDQDQSQNQSQSESHSQSSSSSTSSYVDQMKAQGFDNLTADELISLRVQGVTPEYIKEIRALGLHPTVNELIAMRVQGIEPQYIKDMRATGFNADSNQLVSMRVQGLTPDYVREMRAAGVDGDADQFISLKVQGIEPDYVKEMKAAGFSASLNQLVSMKVQGITPDYVREMRAAGIDGDTNEFIRFKVQGVTPDYIKEMKATGFNATPRELISMKVQGITPDYVREMRAAGIDGDVNKFIGFKVQGVTPDYIREMKAAGVNADANQLIGMKVQGLMPDYVKEMKAEGVDANTNQLIGMKVQGLTPDYVREMKAAGVNANAHQLISMRVQGVTPDYIKALKDAGLSNLDARDYIRARVAGVTPDFITQLHSHGFKDLTIEKIIELKEADVF